MSTNTSLPGGGGSVGSNVQVTNVVGVTFPANASGGINPVGITGLVGLTGSVGVTFPFYTVGVTGALGVSIINTGIGVTFPILSVTFPTGIGVTFPVIGVSFPQVPQVLISDGVGDYATVSNTVPTSLDLALVVSLSPNSVPFGITFAPTPAVPNWAICNGTLVTTTIMTVIGGAGDVAYKSFGLQVFPTGVSFWSVFLEGSMEGSTFFPLLNHNTNNGSAEGVFTGANLSPCFYFRARLASLTPLGTFVTVYGTGST